MKKILPFLLIFALFFNSSMNFAFAKSSYVLPYPSFIPGSSFYRIHLFWEEIMRYWYFGSFGQFKYSLKQADKYLIEAKTLFEYNQYFLAVEALHKSDDYFMNIRKYLIEAEKKGRDITEQKQLLDSASLKHQEILKKIKTDIPEKFLWQPEKGKSTLLDLEKIIENSIQLRKDSLRS